MIKITLTCGMLALGAAQVIAQVGGSGGTAYTEQYYGESYYEESIEIGTWTNTLDYSQLLNNVIVTNNQTQNVTGSTMQNPPYWSGELAVLTTATVTNSGGPWSFTVASGDTVTYWAYWGETDSEQEFNVIPPNENIWRYASPYWSPLGCNYVIGS